MNVESSELSKQLHCYRNIHMYDFHDDAGHHSVNKSFPIKGKTQVKLGHPWAPLGTICTLDIVDIFWQKLLETLLFWT